MMDYMSIIPLPSQHHFFVRFEISQGKDSEGQGVLLRPWAKKGTKNGVWPTSIPYEAGAISSDSRVKGNIEGRSNEMDEGFWHA